MDATASEPARIYIAPESQERDTAEGQHTVQQTTDISQQTTERPHDRKTYGTQNKTNTRDWKRSGTEQNEKLRRRGRVKVGGGRTTTDNAGSGNPEERRDASKPA